MLVPNRHHSYDDYRYSFQGQEKDDELKGKGNSINYTFRMHDPRVGRFFAVDPLAPKYPFYSPYQFSGNRVIDMVELEGLEPKESGAREAQQGEAFDYRLIGDNPGNAIAFLFSHQSWIWHAGTPTTNSGWYTKNEYKEIVMPYALDAARFNGYKMGFTWHEARDLLNQNGAPLSGDISEGLIYFLTSRVFDGQSGIDMLTEIGSGRIYTFNLQTYNMARGLATQMDFDSPIFIVGTLSKSVNIFTRPSNLFQRSSYQYSAYGTEAFNTVEYYQLGRASNGRLLPLTDPSTLFYGRGGNPFLYDVASYNLKTPSGIPSVISNASTIQKISTVGLLGIYGLTKYTVDKNMNDTLDKEEEPKK